MNVVKESVYLWRHIFHSSTVKIKIFFGLVPIIVHSMRKSAQYGFRKIAVSCSYGFSLSPAMAQTAQLYHLHVSLVSGFKSLRFSLLPFPIFCQYCVNLWRREKKGLGAYFGLKISSRQLIILILRGLSVHYSIANFKGYI